jgi:hypothetical protein
MAVSDSSGSQLKLDEDHRFLREVIYTRIKDFNTGFDSPLIGHFSLQDFLVVIDHSESFHVHIRTKERPRRSGPASAAKETPLPQSG